MRNQLLSSVAAVALVAVTSGTSLAAESADWNGFYVGAHLGGGGADFLTRDLHDGDGTANNEPTGVVGGAHVGYNWQFDTFVLGLEADVSGTDWSKDEGFSGDSDRVFDADVDLLASLRARIGMTFDRSLLIRHRRSRIRSSAVGGVLGPSGLHLYQRRPRYIRWCGRPWGRMEADPEFKLEARRAVLHVL